MDMTCRFGGEEFAVVLPKCTIEGAAIVAERLRTDIEGRKLSLGDVEVGVTVSLGCAQYLPGEKLSDLVERADQALYRAKHNGRNRVEISRTGEEDLSIAQ